MRRELRIRQTTIFFALISLLNLYTNRSIAAEPAVSISGVITEAGSNEPIAGATIQIKGTVTGTVSDATGKFTIITKEKFPLTLVVSLVGYTLYEAQVSDPNAVVSAQLQVKPVNSGEVVVTASRVEENIMQSPVSIEKMDTRCIRETPAPTFFDAMESVKGVQMTTLSMGMKVPNTRGFANTSNARFLEMVDGADMQAPGLGVSISNTVGPTELDIQSAEIIPGASSALYGMSALNGMANFITKDPFIYQGLSVYQRTGINHVGDANFSVKPFTETALRYAKSFKDKFAFKINVGYMRGTDWVADDHRDLNATVNASTGISSADNPGKDPINSYGNESDSRKTIKLGDGKTYEIRRTGFFEKDFADYKVENLKFDVGLKYRVTEKLELSYTGRAGSSDAVYQRGNRIKLDDYWVQQHKLEVKGSDFSVKLYGNFEHSKNSYNMRPMGQNLDRATKSDAAWFSDYQKRFNAVYKADSNSVAANQQARAFADSGRLVPGTQAFTDEVHKLAGINNWDSGAQLYMKNLFYQAEANYNFSRLVKYFDLQVGADFRDYIIQPDGNSFTNPDTAHPLSSLNYWKVGGYMQASKTVFNGKLKLIGSIRLDKADNFPVTVNPRVALVYSPSQQHSFRISYQNGFRFPTLFEAFSSVNNGGVIRYGGLQLLTEDKQLFENSYLKVSSDDFQKAVLADINKGIAQADAIVKEQGRLKLNPYTYIKPEHINAFEVGYKGTYLNDRIFLDADFYYNIYDHFIDQVDIIVPKAGDAHAAGTAAQVYDKTGYTGYRMWTNALSTYHNLGASVGVNYYFYKTFSITGNYSFAKLVKVDQRDAGLETAFNTPSHIVNVSFANRNVYKNIGFNVSWRWQDAFLWKSPLANGTIPAYSTIDLQVSYKVPKINALFKLGGTNILNHYYTQYTGGPAIGAMYYLAVTVDGLFKGK